MLSHKITIVGGMLLSLTLLSGAVLSAPKANADTSPTVDLTVNVPVACSLSPENTYLENTIYPGTPGTIGTAKIKAVCNDPSGFAIYSVGFTGDNYGDNNLRMIENGSLSQTYIIPTGTATTGDTSGWNMSIAKDNSVSGNYEAIIENGFDTNNNVPSTFTKIASLNSTTDQIIGANLLAQFDAYVAPAQAAGSYQGKVKFTLVHPSASPNPGGMIYYDANGGINAPDPQAGEEGSETGTYNYTISSQIPYKFESVFLGWAESPDATEPQYQPEQFITISKPMTLYAVWREAQITILDTGSTINAKLKNLANNITDANTDTIDSKIKAFLRTDTLPEGFVATSDNTISSSTSTIPIYIFFDDTDEKGIMHYFSEADIIYANPQSAAMFKNAKSLADISGLASWDTTNITDMGSMFLGTSITNVDALATGKNGNPNIWNTSNVTTLFQLFNGANSLADISGLANWDTAKVTNMATMFGGGVKITNVDALATGKNGNPNIWNTSNVTSMNYVFTGATLLTDISGLANWDTAKVTSMTGMFTDTDISNVDALATGKNGNPNTWNTGKVTSMSSMFAGAHSLADLSGLSNWDTAKVTNMSSMFAGVNKINNIEALTPGKNGNTNIWNTGNVTNMNNMFINAASLVDISGLANWDTAKVTDTGGMFYGTKITNVDALATGKNGNPNIWNTGNVTNMSYMFYNTTSLTDISGIAKWDTTKVNNMSQMFRGARIVDVDALATGKNGNPNIWNTGNVTNMSYMFNGSALADISGLSDWDTTKLVNMTNMFSYSKITNVDALATGKNGNPNIWNTGNVTNMNGVFSAATSLVDISGIANWDTSSVTDMSHMFSDTRITNANSLAPGKNGNQNIWNTGNVINMTRTFYRATSLSDISAITNWNVSNVQATDGSTSEDTNKFYWMFDSVPSSAVSGFSFTSRPGSVISGTYVPGANSSNSPANNGSPANTSGNATPMSTNSSYSGTPLAMQYYSGQTLSDPEQTGVDESDDKKDDTTSTKSETVNTKPLGVQMYNETSTGSQETDETNESNVFTTVAIAGAGLAAVTGAVILLGKKRNKNEAEQ